MPLRMCLVFTVITTFFAGCAFHVASPPARMGIAESPLSGMQGAKNISVETFVAAEIFGPTVSGITGRIPFPIDSTKSVQFRPIIGLEGPVDIRMQPSLQNGQSPYFWGFSADIKKLVPLQNTSWNASGWVGGGYLHTSVGEVFAPYCGGSVGYEGWYIRPFVSGEIFSSFPFRKKNIYRTSWDGENKSSEGKKFTQTIGVRPTLGFKIQWVRNFAFTAAAGIPTMESATDAFSLYQGALSTDINF